VLGDYFLSLPLDDLAAGATIAPADLQQAPRSGRHASSLARPPRRWWAVRRDLFGTQRDQVVALIGIAPDSRAILAAHAALQLMDRGCLPPADDFERNGLVRVAAEAADFHVAVPGIEGLQGR
jgi:hypothetical protein